MALQLGKTRVIGVAAGGLTGAALIPLAFIGAASAPISLSALAFAGGLLLEMRFLKNQSEDDDHDVVYNILAES